MDLGRVLEDHHVLALAAHVAELCDRGARVLEEPRFVRGIDPRASHDPGAVARSHFSLVRVDQRVEGRRIHEPLLDEEGLERPHSEVGLRERRAWRARVVVIVVVTHRVDPRPSKMDIRR